MNKLLKRLLLLALLAVPWATQAQDTLTVADGTTTNSYVPFYGLWMDANQHNQILYPATMTAEIVGDSIKGMGFYMSSSNSTAWGATVTISLGISSNATLTGLDNSTVLTQVWSGTVDGQGDIWITFDNAYAFQGGNLLVDFQSTTAGNYGSSSFYGVSQPAASFYSYNTSGYSQDFIPKTSFIHVDGDFEVCHMPTNLVTEVDSNQIAISWNGASGVSSYNVYLNDTLLTTVSDTFYTFTELSANTIYRVAVASVCGDGESPALGGSFRTNCAQMVIPYTANFDNDPYGVFPPCWNSVITYGTDPSVNTVFSHSGSQSMYMQASNDTNLFASSAIPLAGNNIKVSYWLHLSASYDNWLQAGVMTDPSDASTFIPLQQVNYHNEGNWKNYEFTTYDLSADATYYLAFLYYGTSPYNDGAGAIDDITIDEIGEGCIMPRAVIIDSVDSNFVTLAWTAGFGGSSYELAYATSNNIAAATVISDISGVETYSVNNLNPGILYYFWMRSVCDADGSTSEWFPAGSVRTACASAVNAPYSEDFTTYANYGFPACWTRLQGYDNYGTIYPYVNSYNQCLYFNPHFGEPNTVVMPKLNLPANQIHIELTGYIDSYNPVTMEVGYLTNPEDASTFQLLGQITGSSATDFEFTTDTVTAENIWIAFRATTTGQYANAYLNNVTVGRINNCPRPGYLLVDTVGVDMAVLHCDSTGENYEVLYSTVNDVNAAAGMIESFSSNVEMTLTSLEPATHYYTWVRTVCDDEAASEWRQGSDFTTMCGEDFCLTQVVMHDVYGDGWNGCAIEFYVNGMYTQTATIDNGNYGVASQALCDEDTLTLVWINGNFAYETSFEVSVAGSEVLPTVGGDSFANGEFIYGRRGCPSCIPPINVAVDDNLTTANSLTIHWDRANADQSEWGVFLNDTTLLGVATDTFYVLTGLQANTGYSLSVASECGGEYSSKAPVFALTGCEGNGCAVVAVMTDSYYGYGMEYSNLAVYQNGYLHGNLSTSDSYVMHLEDEIPICEGEPVQVLYTYNYSYTYYLDYVNFEIRDLNDNVLASSADSTMSTMMLVLSDTVHCPTCVAVNEVEVENQNTTTSTISWNDNSNGTSYSVIVSNEDGIVFQTVSATSPVTVSNLTPGTSYEASVRALCSEADSSAARRVSFVSMCEEITLPWTWVALNDPSAFNTTMPLCWYAPASFMSYGDNYPTNTSYYGLDVECGNGNSSMAVTPRIPEAGNNIYVRFNGMVYRSGGTLTAGVMTDPNDISTYIPVLTLTNNTDDFVEYEFTTDAISSLSATDTVYVAFYAYSAPGGYASAALYVNDLYVKRIPDCNRPTNLVVSNVTDVNATLSWDATNATNYSVFYGDTVINVTTNTVTLTNLTAGTTYQVIIQGNCTTDSSLLLRGEFTTLCVAKTLPWFEDFESFDATYSIPNCWSAFNQYPDYSGNMSPYINNYSYNAHSGTNSLSLYGTSANHTMAVGPELAGEAINSLYVSFWFYGGGSYGFDAGLMTDPTDTNTFIPLLSVPSTSYNHVEYSFNTTSLTSTDSNYHFAIRYNSSSSYSGSVYVDDITVMRMPDCSENFESAVVNNITGNTASLSWTPGLGINADATYTVTLMDANYGTVSTFDDATSPLALSDLGSNTEYNICVSINCGGTVSAVSDTVNFSTLCSGLDTFYSFDPSMTAGSSNYAPMGYSYYNYGYVQTIIDSARMVEGDIVGFAFLPDTAAKGDYYTHMDVYMANVSETDLSEGWIVPDDEHEFVQVMTDADLCYDTADWQRHTFGQRFTWDGQSNVLVTIRRGHGSYSSGARFAVHSDATTTAKTRYGYNDNYPYDITDPSAASTNGGMGDFVGDFMFLVCGDACPAPTSLAVTNLSYDAATLNWSGNAEQYEVAYKMAAEATWPAEVSVNGNSLQLVGLQPATSYMARVRTICDAEAGEISEWAEFTFVTDSLPCFAPTALEATATSYTSVTLDWTAGGIETQWGIHVWNTNFDTTIVVNAHPATVGGLDQAMTYNAEVKSICGGGLLESEYCEAIPFTTATCEQVTGLAVSNVTATSAVVSWDGNASSYEIDYGGLNHSQGTGTVVTTTGNSYTITGLEPDMMYSVFVRAICETGVYGAWSAQEDFQTPEGTEGIQEANSAQIAIQPNPANESTTIVLSGVNGDVTVSVVDMNGRVVLTESMSCSGNCQKRIDVDGLAQGAYFVRLSGADLNMVKKLIVK